jgi:hypothetical protein
LKLRHADTANDAGAGYGIMRQRKTAAFEIEYQSDGFIQALGARLQWPRAVNEDNGLAGFVLRNSHIGNDGKIACH